MPKAANLKTLPTALIRNLLDAVRVQIKYLLLGDGNKMKLERDSLNMNEIMQSLVAFINV